MSVSDFEQPAICNQCLILGIFLGGMCCSFSLTTSMQLTLGLPNFRGSRFLAFYPRNGAPKNANQFQEMRSLARTCLAWKEHYFLIHSAHCPWHSPPAKSWELIQSVPASHWNVWAFLAPSHNRSQPPPWTTSQHAQYCRTTCMQIQSKLYSCSTVPSRNCLAAFQPALNCDDLKLPSLDVHVEATHAALSLNDGHWRASHVPPVGLQWRLLTATQISSKFTVANLTELINVKNLEASFQKMLSENSRYNYKL